MDGPARSPWVAIDVATDPVAHARRLRRAHEQGIAAGPWAPAPVRALVLESWRRSLAAGVAADQGPAPLRLTAEALEAARGSSPLAAAAAVIQAILASVDADARHVVAIADAHASLLWVAGDPAAQERAREMGFAEGASWSENDAGTNAVGTAAALDHPVQIFSAEHLVEAVHSWTCSAAPIHDPVTHRLIGVVDLTADLKTNHPHTLLLVAAAARAAEAALEVQAVRAAERLRERWEAAVAGRRTPTALFDRHGRVLAVRGASELPPSIGDGQVSEGELIMDDGRAAEVEALGDGAILWLREPASRQSSRLHLRLLGHDPTARTDRGWPTRALRSLELLAILSMHHEGMTTEQLALALYGERGKAVTIRAQVHRVRTFLGPRELSTRPYRLHIPVDADWHEVQRHISAGRPAEALSAYAGPLLAASDAPEIVEARELLEESLRRSILTTADPELLARWLAHPAGAHDLPAARALVASLPAGDPRRAAATATAAMITRRSSAVDH